MTTCPHPAPGTVGAELSDATKPHLRTPTIAALGPSSHFKLTANGLPVPVHQARVSAIPFNRVWPGHQRSLDQTELASFVTFDADFSTPVTIHIEILPAHPRAASLDADGIALRPAGYGLMPDIDRARRTLTLTLDRARHFTVEIGGYHHALHLFANPRACYELPPTGSADLIHFGPGVHHAGLILPRTGQTVHIAEGAVVYGAILVRHAHHVRIVGRGILDGSPFLRGQEADETQRGGELFARGLPLGIPRENLNYTGNITAIASDDLSIDGIILRDSPLWSVNIRNGCRHVTINNVKIIGQWRYNADGVNICSSSHVRVSNCFIRSFDDCVIARGTHMLGEDTPLTDMHVTGCVLWCDWGRALEVWTGYKPARISRVTFEDIHIIRTTHLALDILAWWGSPDTRVAEIRFENISIEADHNALPPLIQTDDTHTYPFPPSASSVNALPLNPHVPDLFCANVSEPGEQWENYFPGSREAAPARHVCYHDITLKNIVYTGPATPLPHIAIGTRNPALRIKNIRVENIRLNTHSLPASAPLNLTAQGAIENLTFNAPVVGDFIMPPPAI